MTSRKSRYYSDAEADEIVWLCKSAFRDAMKQMRQHLKDGVRFDEEMGRAQSLYGGAAVAIKFGFRAAAMPVEVVSDQIEEGDASSGAPPRGVSENGPERESTDT